MSWKEHNKAAKEAKESVEKRYKWAWLIVPMLLGLAAISQGNYRQGANDIFGEEKVNKFEDRTGREFRNNGKCYKWDYPDDPKDYERCERPSP